MSGEWPAARYRSVAKICGGWGRVLAILWIGIFPCLGDEAVPPPDSGEHFHDLEVDYQFHRDGRIDFEQRFRLEVAGQSIQRGPLLNYLTVLRGPGGLVLDKELEILEVNRDGAEEPYHMKLGEGFVTLYIGESEHLLEHRVHHYRVRGRMEGDWRQGRGTYSTSLDITGPLPALPIHEARVRVRLPAGVSFTHHTPSVTGAEPDPERKGPLWRSRQEEGELIVETTAPLGKQHAFFLNLTWPSESFAGSRHWLKILRQHPRLPLAGFSGILLLWALLQLMRRAIARRA